jgi:hypothetical protein
MSAENIKPTESPRAALPERLPAEFYSALEELNRGEYFACHETLEALWIPETRDVRQIYQGVLQIAVGCYHLVERRNWVGAVNKLDAGARRLERLGLSASDETAVYGVDWPRLIADADRLQAHLRALGRENVARFDRALLPVAVYT